MEIHAFRFAPYALPFARPFPTSREILYERTGWLIWIQDGEGRWGLGEVAPLPGFGMESHQEAGKMLAFWAETLPGEKIDLAKQIAKIPDFAEQSVAFGLARSVPSICANAPASIHGLELALLDLAGQRTGKPLHRLLSSSSAPAVKVNATLGAGTMADSLQQSKNFTDQGFQTLKVKVGRDSYENDFARLRQIRQRIGKQVRLRIDANGSWQEAEALQWLDQLAVLDIEYVEQPLPAQNLEGMARLTQQSPIPIAADESVLSLEDAGKIVEQRAAHLLILKPMALGGVLTTLAIARLAASQQMPVVITTTLEGAFARAGATHAAAALQGLLPGSIPTYAHGLATGSMLSRDFIATPLEAISGMISLPDSPGLGLPGLAAPSDL